MTGTLSILHLRTLVAIAEAGGFSRAGRALHLSQPAVSQHVRALEKCVGRPLVEKSGRGARFTDVGDRLLVEARQILLAHDRAIARLEEVNPGSIVVGSTEPVSDAILPELMAAIRTSCPLRTVQFHIGRSRHLTRAVLRSRMDLAVTLSLEDDHAGVEVGSLPLHWYASPFWQPPDAGRPWSMVGFVAPCGMRKLAIGELARRGVGVTIAAESTSLAGVVSATRAGLGVAVLPSGCSQDLDGLVVRRDLPPLGQISVRLVTRPDLDPMIVETAFDALRTFYASWSHLQAVAGAVAADGAHAG